MTRVVRTSIIAVLALVASLLGVTPAQALPAGSTPLFAAGPSGTPEVVRPLGQTSAGLVYSDGSGSRLWVSQNGGTPQEDTQFRYASVIGDLIYQRNWLDGTISWRTIADDTLRTHTVADGDTYLTGAPSGYIAQRGSDPYQLVRITLATGAATVVGTSSSPFQSAQAGTAGVVATNGSSVKDSYLWFPDGSSSTGQPVTVPAGSTNCALAAAHLYCADGSQEAGGLHRVALPSGTTTTVPSSPWGVVETSSGVAFMTLTDPESAQPSYTLWTWPTSASAPSQRIDETFGLTGELATGVAGTVLVSRTGSVGQGGLWSVPVPTGTATLVQPAPAAPRVATGVAIAPGTVAWADNERFDGAIWARDLSSAGQPSSAQRLIAGNATSTTLSISGDRATYTQGRGRFGGSRLLDGSTTTALNESGIVAALSGDRLLYQSRVFVDQDVTRPWSLRNLRTGAVTALPDALDYDLWGERLARLDADGSVWVSNLRTGAPAVQVRAATPAPSLWGTVHIAGDSLAWSITRGEGQTFTDENKVRNVRTLTAATDVTGLNTVTDLSSGYAFGPYCGDGLSGCGFIAVNLSTGQATPFENIAGGALDGNLVAYVGSDKIPAVVALPAYADAPRLLAAPGAGTSLTTGGSWSARVVASRVLTTCAVEVRNSANTLVRSLPCTDSNAATTVTWDGRDTAGALVPAGSYSWRIVANTGGDALVDYDGTTTALAGTVGVAGSGPAVTAQSPAANGTSAAVTTNVTATFSKAVQGVSATTFRLRTAAGTAISSVVSYNATTRIATLNPGVNLTPDTRYTATLTGGTTAIRDGANVPLPTTSWTFTTGPAPTATTVTPAVNGTSFSVTGNPTAVFSEAVTGVSGTTFTLATATGTAVPAAVTYDAATRRATLNPTATLTADTRYTLTLTGGATAVRDAAGNPLATRSWSFTTGPAPTVTSRTPASGATGVVNTSNVTAVFSEAVQGVSGTTFRLRNPAGTVITAVVTYNSTTRTATLNPSANLAAATRYTVGLAGGATAIRDAAGNPLSTLTWAFTTR